MKLAFLAIAAVLFAAQHAAAVYEPTYFGELAELPTLSLLEPLSPSTKKLMRWRWKIPLLAR